MSTRNTCKYSRAETTLKLQGVEYQLSAANNTHVSGFSPRVNSAINRVLGHAVHLAVAGWWQEAGQAEPGLCQPCAPAITRDVAL